MHFGGECVACTSSCSESFIFSNVGSPSMGMIESVLNFSLMSLSLTLGMVGMYVLRPKAQTVMFGLLCCNPGAEPDVTGWFPVVAVNGVRPLNRPAENDWLSACCAVLDKVSRLC